MRILDCSVITLILLTAFGSTGSAQPAGGSQLSIDSVRSSQLDEGPRFGVGDRVTVEISGEVRAITNVLSHPEDIVLLLNDVALFNLCSNVVVLGQGTNTTESAALQFVLERNHANKTFAWSAPYWEHRMHSRERRNLN